MVVLAREAGDTLEGQKDESGERRVKEDQDNRQARKLLRGGAGEPQKVLWTSHSVKMFSIGIRVSPWKEFSTKNEARNPFQGFH